MEMKNLINEIKGFVKANFQIKNYFMICAFIFVFSVLRPCISVSQNDFLYTYQYGFFMPWITIYKNIELGSPYLISCILGKGYTGISWEPQYIFIDAAVICLIWIALRQFTQYIRKEITYSFGKRKWM